MASSCSPDCTTVRCNAHAMNAAVSLHHRRLSSGLCRRRRTLHRMCQPPGTALAIAPWQPRTPLPPRPRHLLAPETAAATHASIGRSAPNGRAAVGTAARAGLPLSSLQLCTHLERPIPTVVLCATLSQLLATIVVRQMPTGAYYREALGKYNIP